MKIYDVAILGSGPGGYVSAILAAQNGLSVCVIEEKDLGGMCLNWGCIPTKSFAVSAEAMETVKKSQELGVNIENFSLDYAKVIDRKNKVVGALQMGLKGLLSSYKIDVIFGKGFIKNNKIIKIKNTEDEIEFKNLIIATGAVPRTIAFSNIDKNRIAGPRELLALENKPKKLLIIGGGVIGCEFASIYSSFGTEVTILEKNDSLLYYMDESIIKEITRAFKRRKINMIFNQEIQAFTEKNSLDGFDSILLSAGMASPLINNPLGELKIELNERGYIKIDDYCRTNHKNIYAAGDVTGINQLAHVAYKHAHTVIYNILGKKEKMDYRVIPNVIFTHPEIASVGLSELEAKKLREELLISIFPFSALGRAKTMGENNGFVKIIAKKIDDSILGVHAVGPHASEIIAEAGVCMQNNLKVCDIYNTIHAHPTMSEGLLEAALGIHGKAVHMLRS